MQNTAPAPSAPQVAHVVPETLTDESVVYDVVLRVDEFVITIAAVDEAAAHRIAAALNSADHAGIDVDQVRA